MSTAVKSSSASRFTFTIIDDGKTRGFLAPADSLSRAVLEDMLERLEASTPEFQQSLTESRKSGRVSAASIEARLGIA